MTGERETGIASPIRLLLIDDQPLFLSGLELLLGLTGEFLTAGTIRTVREARIRAADFSVDAIVLDVGLPDGSGIELARNLRAGGVHAPILILSNHDAPECVLSAVRAGVQGYLLKDVDADRLRAAIRTVADGRRYIDERLLGFVMDALSADASEEQNGGLRSRAAPETRGALARFGLTPREFDVLRLMTEGKNNEEIAKALYLSPKTARNHTSNIFQKLGVRDRTKAVLVALSSDGGLAGTSR